MDASSEQKQYQFSDVEGYLHWLSLIEGGDLGAAQSFAEKEQGECHVRHKQGLVTVHRLVLPP